MSKRIVVKIGSQVLCDPDGALNRDVLSRLVAQIGDLHNDGWQVLLVPEASIMHHQGISSGEQPSRVLRHKHRGMAYYYRKYHAGNASFFTNIAVYAGIYFHLLFSLLRLSMGHRS